MADSSETKSHADVYMPRPPDDLRLNLYLINLADALDEEAFERIKKMLSGNNGFGLGVLEEIKSPRELFTHLQTTNIISKENLVPLQALVWHLGRKDLYDQLVQLAGELGDTLHTFSPVGKPENGYKFVEFHLCGCKVLDKEKVESLRASVARWMLVPARFVTVQGIEPSGSWVITFMVPEICVSVLLERAKTHSHWFTAMDVDRFELDGKSIKIESEICNAHELLDDFVVRENQRLREQVDTLQKFKDQLEVSNIQLSREKASLRKQCEAIEETAEKLLNECDRLFGYFLMSIIYLNIFKRSFVEQASLGVGLRNGTVSKLESALAAFKRNMEKVKKKCYDVELIEDLLESFRFFALKRNLEELRLSQFILSGSFQGNSVLNPVQLGSTSDSTIVQTLTVSFQTGFNPGFSHILKDISSHLQKREADKIMKLCKCFTVDERRACSKDPDKANLLEVILLKYIQDISQKWSDVHQHPDQMIKHYLSHVGRKDLVKKMEDAIQKSKEAIEAVMKQEMNSAYQLLVNEPVVRLAQKST